MNSKNKLDRITFDLMWFDFAGKLKWVFAFVCSRSSLINQFFPISNKIYSKIENNYARYKHWIFFFQFNITAKYGNGVCNHSWFCAVIHESKKEEHLYENRDLSQSNCKCQYVNTKQKQYRNGNKHSSSWLNWNFDNCICKWEWIFVMIWGKKIKTLGKQKHWTF